MTVERPTAFVSTGELPPPEHVRMLMDDAHERFASMMSRAEDRGIAT
jgi:hypothetical protein